MAYGIALAFGFLDLVSQIICILLSRLPSLAVIDELALRKIFERLRIITIHHLPWRIGVHIASVTF